MGRSKEVDVWLARYDNPMRPVAQRIHEIILDVDPRVSECIKWQAPTFTFEGNIASFFPRAKQHASLMFHHGAKIPGRHPILEGGGATSRVVKIGSVAEANQRAGERAAVVRSWIALKSSGSASATRASKPRPKSKSKRTVRKIKPHDAD